MTAARIKFYEMREDPDLWEKLIENEIRLGDTDPAARAVVESMYWEADREQAFERFRRSVDFEQIADLFDVFGISKDASLCEIGGGSGQLAWALFHHGFRNVELLEPNGRFITGTAYLTSRLHETGGGLSISNDLGDWYADTKTFTTIVTRNCVHHFPNLALVAAALHQKVAPGGKWVMIREFYADTPQELRHLLATHPYCQKYGVYEFAFPARHYIDSVEFAGFTLTAVVPNYWGNNALSSYCNAPGSIWNRFWSRVCLVALRFLPYLSVFLFRVEDCFNRVFRTRFRTFTRPQMMVFTRNRV